MSSGQDLRLFIENTTEDGYVEVTRQKDGTFNPGKAGQADVTKDGQTAFVDRTGATFETTITLVNPADTAQARLLAVSDAELPVKVKVEDTKDGGHSWYGNALVILGEVSAPVSGVQEATVNVAFDGAVTRGTSPVAYA